MVRVDGIKVGEIKDHFNKLADEEIAKATADGTELKHDDLAAIRNKHTYQAVQLLVKIFDTGPKQMFKAGFAHDDHQWREGYTKPTVASRVAKRRKKNKNARAARKLQRKNK